MIGPSSTVALLVAIAFATAGCGARTEVGERDADATACELPPPRPCDATPTLERFEPTLEPGASRVPYLRDVVVGPEGTVLASVLHGGFVRRSSDGEWQPIDSELGGGLWGGLVERNGRVWNVGAGGLGYSVDLGRTWDAASPSHWYRGCAVHIEDDVVAVGGRASIGRGPSPLGPLEWTEIPALDDGEDTTTNLVHSIVRTPRGFVAVARPGHIASAPSLSGPWERVARRSDLGGHVIRASTLDALLARKQPEGRPPSTSIAISCDDGTSWRDLGSVPASWVPGHCPPTLLQTGGGVLLAPTNDGFALSCDYGQTWSPFDVGTSTHEAHEADDGSVWLVGPDEAFRVSNLPR